MDFKPPLSFAELHEIGQRNKENKDVTRLLWEIRRLHNVVGRAYQLARSISGPDESIGMIVGALLNQIKDDPVVIERDRMNAELFGQKTQPGDED